jgi:hypothetical protein
MNLGDKTNPVPIKGDHYFIYKIELKTKIAKMGNHKPSGKFQQPFEL